MYSTLNWPTAVLVLVVSLFSGLSLKAAAQSSSTRLPTNLWPEHYDVEIRPDFYPPLTSSQFFFDGWVTIHLRCDVPTTEIHLNFKQLSISTASIDVRDSTNGKINVAGISSDSSRQLFVIQLDRQLLATERIQVSMNFTGPLLRDNIGFYYSQYTEGGVTKYMLGTQFQASDARKSFPCLDEPYFKSTYTVTLWRKEPMIALSNTPSTSDTNAGYDGWRIVNFEKTNVVMSSYLLAFAIANYSSLEAVTDSNFGGETPVRQWARPELVQKGQADYAQSITADMLEYLEIHFNHSYRPLKLDNIAITDFAFGAMENWGLITYRETRLVIDPDYSGEYDRERMAMTTAHELVHMWLGDVVTCEWWSDIWTQEGAARFYQYRSVGYVEPTWDVVSLFIGRTFIVALNVDDNGNMHPLYYDGDRATSSNIIYDKGSCILRMVEHQFLGYDTFQRAMISYVDENQYSTVTHEDLLRAWDRQATLENLNLPVNVTVAGLTWIRQAGFPVIKLSVRADGVTVDVTQRLFLELPGTPLDEYYPSPYGYTWYVPITYVTSNGWDTVNTLWLQRDNRTMTLPASIGSTGWILGNYRAYGYYRVTYDDNTWTNIINQLNSNHLAFNVSNRAMLLHDSNTIAKAGELRHVIALRTTEYLAKEDQWSAWYAADLALVYVNLMLSQTVSFGKYKEYIKKQIKPVYTSLTWEDQPGDPIHTIHMRSLAIDIACKYGDADCHNNAWTRFSAWRSSPEDLTIIRPDIRRATICAALSRSLTDSWDFVFERYQLPYHGPDALDRSRLRDALTCSTDKFILNNYFTMAATNDARIYPSDTTSVMTGIAATELGNDVAWDYLSVNWNAMSSNRLTVLETVVQRFSNQADLYALEQFFVKYPAQSEDEQKRYDQMLRVVNANIRWQLNNYEETSAWLDTVVPTDAKSVLSMKPASEKLTTDELAKDSLHKKADSVLNENIV